MRLRTSSYSGSWEIAAACANAIHWKAECNEPLESPARNFAGRANFQNQRVDLMSAMATSTTFLSVQVFPPGVEAHWETENRTLWNELQHASEERELVYEISWIAELGVWRRFLRSRRKVPN